MKRPSTQSLEKLFRPRSIAVIGASGTPTKIGGMPIAHLLRYGFGGPVYPVNPIHKEIQGLPTYPNVQAIGRPVDLAIVAVPAKGVKAALTEAAAAKVGAVVLFSSGFAETGDAGARAQQEIAALSRESGMRILGPNCLGVMSGESNLYATFSPTPGTGIAKQGGIGLVSQSGAFGGFAYSLAREKGLGLSHWVTTGNECDIDVADCLDWLVDDPSTKVVLAYMEGCRDGPRFVAAMCKARAAGKPVVIVKVGRTDLGAAAAASHTAALAGADAIYDAVFKQCGAYRAATISEAFDVAYAASVAGLPRGRSIGMLTVSGGAGVLMADAAASAGLDASPLPEAAQAKILARIPFAAARNPVDVTGQVVSDDEVLPLAYSLMLDEGNYDSLVSFQAAAGLSPLRGPDMAQQACDIRARFPDRVIALVSLFTPELQRQLDDAKVLTFADPSGAVRAIAALADLAAAPKAAPPKVRPGSVSLPRGPLNEVEAMACLEAAGIPIVRRELARDKAAAMAAADAIGYPVAAKIVSPDILHKTDVGGVMLNLMSRDAVGAAFDTLMSRAAAIPKARLDGVMIAPMVKGGVECILGIHRDPVFGPVVMFGLGGVLVEALQDVSFRLAPFDDAEARRMIDSIRARPVLDGWRGSPPADLNALAAALTALSRFAVAAGDRLSSVDINPFVVLPRGQGAVALDAVVVVEAKG
jgi:acetate---CoA ligase (ADP-forming)